MTGNDDQITRTTDQPGRSDLELAQLTDQALAGPGVLEMLLVYEAAERAYSSVVTSTLQEPKIWIASSTT